MFNKPISGNLDFSVLLVKTCCALHNFVRTRDGFSVEDALVIDGLVDIGRDISGNSRPTNHSIQTRNKLADYFLSDAGSLPWQTNFI